MNHLRIITTTWSFVGIVALVGLIVGKTLTWDLLLSVALGTTLIELLYLGVQAAAYAGRKGSME